MRPALKYASPGRTRQFFYKFVRALEDELNRGNKDFAKLTKTILAHWLKIAAPSLPASPELSKYEKPLSSVAGEFLDWLAEQPFLESTYWLSSAYAIWSGDNHQKSHAMYFTPPSITKRMLDDLANEQASYAQHVFYDPACGGAAFLIPIAIRLRDELVRLGYTSRKILLHAERHILGSELDPVLCLLSKHFLRAAFEKQITESKREPEFDIVCTDSLLLTGPLRREADVVVCNPPYRKLDSTELAVYRDEYGCVIDSQPNLYALFMSLCLKTVRNDGLVKLISPMSFVSGKTFGVVRSEIQQHAEIVSFGIVRERLNVFMDVEQETIITLMRKRAQSMHRSPSAVFEVGRDGTRHGLGTTEILPGPGVWAIPRSKTDSVIINRGNKCPAKIADYGYRPRIGAFVWNRDQKPTYFSLAEAKKARATLAVPLIWSSDIRGGKPIDLGARRSNENEPLFVDIGDRNHRSLVRHDAVLLQRVTSSDQVRRLVASTLRVSQWPEFAGFLGENHVVILEADQAIPVYQANMLMHVLLHEQVERYFRCISGSTNVSIFELSQLPLPCPQCIKAAIDAGSSISAAIDATLADSYSRCHHTFNEG